MAIGEQRVSFDDGDYSRMDEKTLIVLSHIFSLFPLRVAVHYVRLQGGGVQAVLGRAGAIVAASDVATLRQLSGDNETVTRHFIDWKFRRMAIEGVLSSRLQRMPFSSDLMDFEERRLGDRWIGDLVETIFKNGRSKISVSWENWQDHSDMELLAVDAAVDAHKHISGQYRITQPRMKLPGLPTDLNLPLNDPEPYNRIIPEWFLHHLVAALRKWVPIFEGVIESEGVKIARREVERVSRAERRRRKHHVRYSDGATAVDSDANRPFEAATISNIAPSVTNPIPQPDEYAERQSENAAIRRAIDRVVEQWPTSKKYFEALKSDERITKQEAALSIGRSSSMGRRYQERFKNEVIREGVMPQPTGKPIEKHHTKKK